MTGRSLGPLSERVLALVVEARRRGVDWETGMPLHPTADVLTRHFPILFPGARGNVPAALARLVHRGVLSRGPRGYSVQAAWRERGERLRQRFASQAFSARLLELAESRAYASYCRRTSGFAAAQYGTCDQEQWDAVVAALDVGPGALVLDAGCGTGGLARRLHRTTGASVVGIDIAAGALRAARPSEGLAFAVMDLAALALERATFDAVYCVDAITFAGDTSRAVRALARLLVPGGRLVLLASEVAPPFTAPAGAKRTGAITRALTRAGLRVRVRDFTESEERFWVHAQRAAHALTPAFRSEGRGALASSLAVEAARGVQWSIEGRIARYLYTAVARGRRSARSPAPGIPSTWPRGVARKRARAAG